MRDVLAIGVYGLNDSMLVKVQKCCNQVFFERDISFRIHSITERTFLDRTLDIIFVNVENVMGVFTEKFQSMIEKIKGVVVAIANSIESLLFAFKINSYRAFMNNTSENEICEILNVAVDSMFKKDKICVNTKDSVRMISVDDIIYMESLGNETIIVTDDEQLVSNKSLKQWESLLDNKRFFRCHKSYIVSLKKIKKLEDSDIYFDIYDKEYCISVSVRKKNELKKRLR